MQKNDVVKIDIGDLTVDGAGIGRADGLAVFVSGALPGETVTVKIIKAAKNYVVGRLLNIDIKTPCRRTPFCGVFEKCGGCTLQHLDYQEQLVFKQRHIKSCFARIGGIDIPDPDVLGSENTISYRNKASFPVANIDGAVAAGFYAPRSHRIVPADCPIQLPPLGAIKDAVILWANRHGVSAYDEETQTGILRHIIGRRTSTGEAMAGLVLRCDTDISALVPILKGIEGLTNIVININDKNTNAILGDRSRVVFGDGYLTEGYGGLSFRAGLQSFLQVNHSQSERLYEIAIKLADMKPEDTVFDLFSGIGTLSLLAARYAGCVAGIEYLSDAVEDARENARINGIDNASFFAGDAAVMFDKTVDDIGRPDIIIVDPPRKGCDESLIDKMTSAAPRQIVYVSCNPSTLARDAARICSAGYEVAHVVGVDMFPHTTHVECVIGMQRKST